MESKGDSRYVRLIALYHTFQVRVPTLGKVRACDARTRTSRPYTAPPPRLTWPGYDLRNV